ncbi:MAG: tripartite tricarboxylate transporter substrate binding protein [Dehalobacterium sp.]
MSNRKSLIYYLLICVLVMLLFVGCSSSTPQATEEPKKPAYPEKAIEIVAAGSPGGGLDILARGLATTLTETKLVSQPINVVNKPGGSMGVGMTYVAAKKGDPYTLLINAPGTLTTPLQQDVGVSYRDFTMLSRLVVDDFVVIVPANSPYKTMQELLDAAKKEPKSVKAGGAQVGAPDHIVTYLIQREGQVEFNYLGFNSGGDVMTNLLGNHIDLAVVNPSEAQGHMEAGTIRAIATASPTKLSGIWQDVPTLKEIGLNVESQMWRGLTGPADMPEETVKFWEDTLLRLFETQEWKDFLETNNFTAGYLNSVDFKNFVESENGSLEQILTELGLKK